VRTRTRTALLSLLLLVAFTGCATMTPDASMKAWMGKPVQGAILSWGPPARTITDGADGQVMEWSYWQPAVFIPYVGRVGNYWKTRCFYVHADGTIYAYRWQGL
jgi:hypothetical protein